MTAVMLLIYGFIIVLRTSSLPCLAVPGEPSCAWRLHGPSCRRAGSLELIHPGGVGSEPFFLNHHNASHVPVVSTRCSSFHPRRAARHPSQPGEQAPVDLTSVSLWTRLRHP